MNQFRLCPFCGKRVATLLCDAPTGRAEYCGHPPRGETEMARIITCDKPICEHCATRIGPNIDFCPACIERIKTTPRGIKPGGGNK